MVAILGSFLQYVIVMVILAAVGVGGSQAKSCVSARMQRWLPRLRRISSSVIVQIPLAETGYGLSAYGSERL